MNDPGNPEEAGVDPNAELVARLVLPPAAAQSPEHRISCHRCGNIRKRRNICSRKSCPHIFCGRCCDKMKDEYGPNTFVNGCPVCKEMCCCSNKSISCHRINHCYRKCPASKNKAACSVYKELGEQTNEGNFSFPSNDKPCGILDLLAAVADNQLAQSLNYAEKRTFAAMEASSAAEAQRISPPNASKRTLSPRVASYPVALERPTEPLNTSKLFCQPLYSDFGVPAGYVPSESAIPLPEPRSLPSDARQFSPKAEKIEKIIPSVDDVTAFGTLYRRLPPREDGSLYDLNGIDGFVKPRAASLSAPNLAYPALGRPASVSSFPSAASYALPNLTGKIPLGGSDSPLFSRQTAPLYSPLPKNGAVAAAAKDNVELVYSSNTDPINILALVSSYSSNISNNAN